MAGREEEGGQPKKKPKLSVVPVESPMTKSALAMEADVDPVAFLQREQPNLKFNFKKVEGDGQFLTRCTVKVDHKTYYKTSDKGEDGAKYLVAKHIVELFGWEKLLGNAILNPGNTLCSYVSCRNLLLIIYLAHLDSDPNVGQLTQLEASVILSSTSIAFLKVKLK